MGLWTDRYRPPTLKKLDYHKTQAEHLKNLVQQGDFPHLLFYGPSGAGKKTRIIALIKELYGSGVEKIKLEKVTFSTTSNKKIEVTIVSSNYHIEVNPTDAGIYDRIVVMELIKNIAQTHQLDCNTQRNFKVIVLNDVDHLSNDAQHALRRTMEKYIVNCRIILCANSTSQIIPAIKSRCLSIRVSAPTIDEIVAILQKICKKEALNLPDELAKKIAIKSERNLRRAILMCECCREGRNSFISADKEPPELEWKVYLKETAKIIVSEQTPQKLYEVRNRIYEMLIHGIPTELIFKGLLQELVKNCDMQLKTQVAELAAYYEHRLRHGSKPIYHIEAFIANFMCIYTKFMEELM